MDYQNCVKPACQNMIFKSFIISIVTAKHNTLQRACDSTSEVALAFLPGVIVRCVSNKII